MFKKTKIIQSTSFRKEIYFKVTGPSLLIKYCTENDPEKPNKYDDLKYDQV